MKPRVSDPSRSVSNDLSMNRQRNRSSAAYPTGARELLGLWGDVPGPDLRNPPRSRPYGTLALRRVPTYERDRAARRRERHELELVTTEDGHPRNAVRLTPGWS